MNIYAPDGSYVTTAFPRPLLSPLPAVRFEQLQDLYAPMGEDGQRHPEAGFISADQFRELLDMATAPETSEGPTE